MNKYTDKQIEDTLKLIDSTILNCEKIQPKLKEGTPQFSLTRNRIKALYISKALVTNQEYNFTQEVVIGYKESGRHILQSYDPDLGDDKGIGNTCVGLTGYEMKLFLKKMKRMKMYSGKKVTIE